MLQVLGLKTDGLEMAERDGVTEMSLHGGDELLGFVEAFVPGNNKVSTFTETRTRYKYD